MVQYRRVISQGVQVARRTSLIIDEVEEDGQVVTSVTWKVYR